MGGGGYKQIAQIYRVLVFVLYCTLVLIKSYNSLRWDNNKNDKKTRQMF